MEERIAVDITDKLIVRSSILIDEDIRQNVYRSLKALNIPQTGEISFTLPTNLRDAPIASARQSNGSSDTFYFL